MVEEFYKMRNTIIGITQLNKFNRSEEWKGWSQTPPKEVRRLRT